MTEEQDKPKKPRTGEGAGAADAPAMTESRVVEEPKPTPPRTVARPAVKTAPEPEKRGMAEMLGFKRKISKLRRR